MPNRLVKTIPIKGLIGQEDLQSLGGNERKTGKKKRRRSLSFVELGKHKNTQIEEGKPCQASIPQKKRSEEKEFSYHWICPSCIFSSKNGKQMARLGSR